MCRIFLYYLVQRIEKIANNMDNEQLEKHNRHTHITQQIIKEFTQNSSATYPGPTFSGDLYYIFKSIIFINVSSN